MKVRTTTILFALLFVLPGVAFCEETETGTQAAKPPRTVTITISPETTYITEPLLPDGRVDYYGAINRLLSEGITKENNVAAGIFTIMPGEKETPLLHNYYNTSDPNSQVVLDEVNDYRLRYWQHLGFDAPPDLESLQFASPRVKEGEELEFLLKYYTPEEIIARLYEHQRPQEKDVNPLEFLQEAQKNDHWLLRQAINRDWDDARERFWTEKDFPLLADWMPKSDEMERQMIEISKRPRFYNPIIANSSDDTFCYSTLLPYVQATREAARFLLVRGNWHFAQGDYEKAFECAFASQRIGLAIRTNNAFIVEDLVGIAICGIANHQIMTYLIAMEDQKDVNWLMEKRSEYAANLNAYSIPAVPQWIAWERCSMLSFIASLDNHVEEFSQMLEDYNTKEIANPNRVRERIVQLLTDENAEYDWNKVLRIANCYFDEYEDIFFLPGTLRKDRAFDRIEKRLVALNKELETRSPDSDPEQFIADYMYCLLFPSTKPAFHATLRPDFEAKAVDITFALAAWHKEHGEYPDTLEQLAPKYLDAIPVSPFSEKPIRYFKRDNMLLLSSNDDYRLDGSDETVEKLIAERTGYEPRLRVVSLLQYQVMTPIFVLRY